MAEKTPVVVVWNRTDQCFDDISPVVQAIDSLDYDITVENDGIGPYECWGFRGYDHGHDYAVVESNDCVLIEIKGGLAYPDTATRALVYDLPQSWTVSKSFYTRHARHEEDMVEFEAEVVLCHEMQIKDGKLFVKLWIKQKG